MLMLQQRQLLRAHHIELYHLQLYFPEDKNLLLQDQLENRLELRKLLLQQVPLP